MTKFLAFLFYYYEKHLMFRIKKAWGAANLRRVSKVGKNVQIMGYTRFLDGENIVIGDNVRIGYGCFFFGKGGISIGDHTIISRNVTIYSSNHNYNANMIPYDNSYVNKPVTIGKGVWIGMGVSITPGVTIDDGAIIGMGAVVSRNVLKGEIVVGSSQRTVNHRDMDSFQECLINDSIFSKHYPNS